MEDARPSAETSPRTHRARRAAGCVLLAMMALGLGVRLIHITDPPLDYQPSRQYHSLLIVRNWYLGNGGSAPSTDQRAAAAGRAPLIEPPIMEAMTWAGWELAGREVIWLGGALSAVIWVAGAAFVYALGRRLEGRLAGLVAAGVYLFEPQAIAGSRAFQPDPLMVAALAMAMLALVVDDQEHTRRTLLLAGAASGFAVLIKLVGGFYVLPVIALLVIGRGGWRALLRRRTVVLVGLTVAPALAYLLYGAVVNHYLTQQSGSRFELWLLGTRYYWSQWLSLATVMVGVGPLLVAVAGLVLARGRSRSVLWGLVAGYVAFGLSFDFALSTSIYYHLPLVLPVALGVATTVGALERALRSSREPARWQVAATAAVVVAVVLPVFTSPLVPAPVSAAARDRVVVDAAPIGDAIDHDTRVVVVGPADGDPLRYYGLLAGATWPVSGNQYVRRAEQSLGVSNAEQLRRLEATLGGGHFLVADRDELATHAGLQAYLDDHFTRVAQNRSYLAYDLRRHHPS